MITSLIFTGKGSNDYIKRIKYKEVYKKGLSEKEIKEIRMKTHARGPEWAKVCKTVKDGYQNQHLIDHLLKRKFEFTPYINVLFGPNGCGKTTIIKAIAAYAMCGSDSQFDGMTNLASYSPTNMSLSFIFDDEDKTQDKYYNDLIKAIERRSGNQAKLGWDGYPVYYENFSGRKCYGIGDLEGSLIESGLEELNYMFGKNSISAGQNTIWMINKLTSIATREIDIKKYIEDVENKIKSVNSIWGSCYKAGIDYYNTYYKPGIENNNRLTVLLDEMDKSLDIQNVARLYSEVLPKLVEKYPIQIILVTHSPLILSRNIRENKYYNIISINDDYTNDVLEGLKGFSF